MPFFSVVIPLYNKEDLIEDTLQSVFNQTFKDFEIIIVNDGSTDNSLKIVNQNAKGLKNIFIINQENKGISATRNKGISLAKGHIIALLDADDVWHKTFLNEIYILHNTFPEASLYGTDYYEKFSNKNILEPKKNIDKSLKHKSFLINDFFKANLFQPIVSQSNFAFKKEVCNDLTFDESISLGEDIDFYIKSNLKYTLAYCYKALATIHLNIPNQMTSASIKHEKLPNLDKFEKEAVKNSSLKKYLDNNRYFYAIQYKLENETEKMNKMLENIDSNHLTSKQKILINSPMPILNLLKIVKKFFLKRNIRITGF